mmetsp:Transcript_37697/g.80540  ORF Transcript_37697/g.80540 Transcript_37697/m.80540 type:complete len:231 (+) Transcript_37697:76-768(+)
MSKNPYQCATSCPAGQFCGSDLECHPFGCNDWYQFATSNMTDYDPHLPLSCEERSQWDSEYPGLKNAGVIFGCTGFGGSLPSPPEAVYQPFTRKCTRADEEKLEKFECYEMASKTNFQPFIAEAKDAILDPCSDPASPGVPSFIYQATVELSEPGYGYIGILNPGNATEEFDRTSAMGSMFATLSIAAPPPKSSPTAPLHAPPSEPNVSYMTEPSALLLMGAFYILRHFA